MMQCLTITRNVWPPCPAAPGLGVRPLLQQPQTAQHALAAHLLLQRADHAVHAGAQRSTVGGQQHFKVVKRGAAAPATSSHACWRAAGRTKLVSLCHLACCRYCTAADLAGCRAAAAAQRGGCRRPAALGWLGSCCCRRGAAAIGWLAGRRCWRGFAAKQQAVAGLHICAGWQPVGTNQGVARQICQCERIVATAVQTRPPSPLLPTRRGKAQIASAHG